jgi:hypothetical protein
MTSAGKAYEAAKLVENAVEEVDLMPNVGFLLSGMERQYTDDIRGVGRAAEKIPAKIMLELPLLNAEKEQAVALSIDAGVTIGGTPVVEPSEWRHRSRSGFYERLHHRTPGFVGSSLASQVER